MPQALRGLLLPGALSLLVLAALVSLGNWQMRRMAWKEALIERVEAKEAAEPVPYDRLPAGGGDALEFTRVRLRGAFDYEREFHVVTPSPEGLSWTVVTPFDTGDRIVPVIRGSVPDALKERRGPRPGEAEGPIEIVGRLRGDEIPGWITPENEPGKNVWYYRDAGRMLGEIGAAPDPGRPAFVELEEGPVLGRRQSASLAERLVPPSRHLGYAVTWYGLAASLAAVFAAFAWRRVGSPAT